MSLEEILLNEYIIFVCIKMSISQIFSWILSFIPIWKVFIWKIFLEDKTDQLGCLHLWLFLPNLCFRNVDVLSVIWF